LKEITYILANLVRNCKAKGTKLEHDFRDYFVKWGYLVTRAAGSFGIDLVALKKDYKPVLINVKWKRVYCGPDERKELIDDANRVNGIPILAYKYVPKGKKNGKHCIEFLKNFKSRGDFLSLESLKDQESCPHLLLEELKLPSGIPQVV
jgi:Holliday junction resolvase